MKPEAEANSASARGKGFENTGGNAAYEHIVRHIARDDGPGGNDDI